ncbi:hypothetical protein jhhlp_003135 [Lomentospora prolificans]|uniref:Heterokaryon incompatibility domain-containing protein n=1 Tax=Lomentospora prolificans TaxID=41688 RepID=A0A2N3NG12_9PEZI|nr:hypothetical protein jhhlp_003135 [Lomentospora prolificans]
MASYGYRPLDPEKHEVRLFSLEPGCFSDDIYIRLRHHILSTTSPPRYEALSYVWGSDRHYVPIHIRKQDGETQQLLITHNLFVALRQLRREGSTRELWVDAVCIDQNNVVERSQQVAMMGNIYRCATQVIAWLGLEADGSTHALRYMDELYSHVTVDWVTHEVVFSSACRTVIPRSGQELLLADRRECEAIYHFLMRPWFERLWIIQEIALGRENAIILCGEHSIAWKSFIDAFFCLYSRVERSSFGDLHEPFLARGALIYQLAILQTYGSVEYMRQQMSQSKCGDPRDRVYGVLNLLTGEDQKLGIYPDYSKTVTEVYQNTTLKWIKRYGSLNLLVSCQMTTPPANLPSWVPDWSQPLTLQPVWRPGENGWWTDLVPYSFPTDGTLRGYGVTCATINGRRDLTTLKPGMPLPAFGEEFRDILSFILRAVPREDYRAGETVQEAICRTLVVNLFSDAWVPIKASLRHYEECFHAFQGMHKGTFPIRSQSYADLVIYFARGRCFFTTEEGYIGMAPASAQIGDVVCAVIGCSWPLLLRPTVKDATTYYQLVGDCYVHGLMAHEAIFGELPEEYRQVYCYDPRVSGYALGYLNRKTNNVQNEDPRPKRGEVEKRKMASKVIKDDPELEEERCVNIWRESGVKLTTFDII